MLLPRLARGEQKGKHPPKKGVVNTQNIVSYIETIATLLRDGGVWVNLGPLLFHYEVSTYRRGRGEEGASC